MAIITEDLVKKTTGQYDVECVRILDIQGLGVTRLNNLQMCVNLTELNVANNSLREIAGLEALVCLKRIDLSGNKINSLRRIEEAPSLEEVIIVDNNISTMAALQPLRALPELLRVDIQNVDGSLTNPVCSTPTYWADMKKLLPLITVLDGRHRNSFGIYEVAETGLLKDIAKDAALMGFSLDEPKQWTEELYWTQLNLQAPAGLADANAAARDCDRLTQQADDAIAKAEALLATPPPASSSTAHNSSSEL